MKQRLTNDKRKQLDFFLLRCLAFFGVANGCWPIAPASGSGSGLAQKGRSGQVELTAKEDAPLSKVEESYDPCLHLKCVITVGEAESPMHF